MKKVIFTLPFFLILFLGCSKEEIEPIVNNDPYGLVEIQWKLEDGDQQEIIKVELPELILANESEGIMEVTLNPLKEMQGSSHFQFELPENVNLDSSAVVSVTSHLELLSDSYGYLMGGTKVPFQKEESNFPFRITIEETAYINPNTRMSEQTTVFLKKNTATFKARFVQPESSDSFEVKGKWSGVFYHSRDSYTVYDEIE